MSIKKKIQEVVADDWQSRNLVATPTSTPKPTMTPQQELQTLIDQLPHDQQRVATPAYLTKSIIDALKFIAKHKGVPTATLVRQALIDFIKNTTVWDTLYGGGVGDSKRQEVSEIFPFDHTSTNSIAFSISHPKVRCAKR